MNNFKIVLCLVDHFDTWFVFSEKTLLIDQNEAKERSGDSDSEAKFGAEVKKITGNIACSRR